MHPCISMHAHLHQAEVLQLLIASQHGYPFDLFPWVQRTCNRGMRQFFRRCSGVVFRFYSTCYEGNILNDEEFSPRNDTSHSLKRCHPKGSHLQPLRVVGSCVEGDELQPAPVGKARGGREARWLLPKVKDRLPDRFGWVDV